MGYFLCIHYLYYNLDNVVNIDCECVIPQVCVQVFIDQGSQAVVKCTFLLGLTPHLQVAYVFCSVSDKSIETAAVTATYAGAERK